MFLVRAGQGEFQGDRKGNYLHVCLLIRPLSASGLVESHFTFQQNKPNNAFLSEPGPLRGSHCEQISYNRDAEAPVKVQNLSLSKVLTVSLSKRLIDVS